MAKKKIVEENPNADPSEDDGEFPFVQVARPDIGTLWDVIRRIGGAIIGGDFSGMARGNGAIDVQVQRADPADVAGGENSVIFGTYARASAARSMAFGAFAATDIPDTCNLSGLLILKANYGNPLTYLCERGAAEIVIATDVVDFTLVGSHTIYLPWSIGHKSTFFVDECIVIVSHLPDRIVSAPEVMFGVPTDLDKIVPPTSCTHIFREGRYERFAIQWNEGESALTASVCTAAILHGAGDVLKGRFIWKGMLIEEEEDGF